MDQDADPFQFCSERVVICEQLCGSFGRNLAVSGERSLSYFNGSSHSLSASLFPKLLIFCLFPPVSRVKVGHAKAVGVKRLRRFNVLLFTWLT